MSSPEALIARGRAVLALDTNALRGFKRLQQLCNVVNHLRKPPEPLDLRLCVPSVVHMEVLFDLRQMKREEYDAQTVVQGLIDKGLEILPFDKQHAEHAAARLGASFPSDAEWHAGKRKRCLQCLGGRDDAARLPGSGKRCGATVDFVIAAHAAHEGWILVTNDDGPDFAGLELKMTLERVEQLLAALLEQRRGQGTPPPS